jgi:hypothetical protein
MSSLALAKIESLTGNTSISVSSAGQATFEHVISQPGSFMFRNKLINGNFDIWQRGTSQTISGYGSADRWVCSNAESTKTASRQAFDLGQMDVPGNPKYFMRHVVTSVAGSGNQVHMYQNIEGVSTLAGKTATLSFWAKADSNKNIAVEFAQVFGTGGSPSSAITAIESQLISLSSSWTKYTVTVNIPSISGKTLGSDGNNHAGVIFWFDAGSNFNVRAANLGQQSGTFDIAQVQIEEGAVATPFEQRPIGVELGLCQRYYLRWSTTQNTGFSPFFGFAPLTNLVQATYSLPVEMRVTPFAVDTGGSFRLTDKVNNFNITSISIIGSPEAGSTRNVPINFSVSSGLTTFRGYYITANGTGNALAYIGLSAEL